MNRTPIQIRLDDATLERLDKLTERIKREQEGSESEAIFARLTPTRSDAIRAAILKGLEVLENRKRSK